MIGLLACWSAVVLWGALLWRPPSQACQERLAALRPAVAHRRRIRPVVTTGRALRSLLGRDADPVADRRVGLTALVLVAGVVVDVTLGLAGGAGCWLILRRRELRRRRRAGGEVLAGLPEAVDLFALACSAGLSVRLALDAVAPRLLGPVGDALRRAQQQIRLGVDTAEALEALPSLAGEPLRLLVRPLTDALRYGSSLGPALERAAATARDERRRQVEMIARQVPLRLLFPLTVCVLPAFVLLTVVPTVAHSLDLLQL